MSDLKSMPHVTVEEVLRFRKAALDRIKELEASQPQWVEVTSEEDEPPEALLNKLGRGRFLCRVAHRGTMIEATRLEMVEYSMEHGFNVLPFDKPPLITGVTHWTNIIPPKGDTNELT